MEELINLKINNMPISVKKGTKILQAAQMLHIDIPHLCYHPDQRIKARCRICSVEVVGRKRLLNQAAQFRRQPRWDIGLRQFLLRSDCRTDKSDNGQERE